MRNRKLCAPMLAISVGMCSVVSGQPTDEPGAAEIGKAAPDFTLKSIDGKEVKLSDYLGKFVVLEWTNHQCPFVKRFVADKHRPQKISATYARQDVVWLSIDSSHFVQDKIDDIKAFRQNERIEYPLLLDPAGKVGRAYGAKTTPHLFVIDREGKLRYAGAPDDDRAGDKTNPRLYVEEAIRALIDRTELPLTKTQPYGCTVKYAG